MNVVQPIRNIKVIEKMKRLMLKDHKIREYVLFTIGINFGIRISDILALKWKDIWDGKKFHDQIAIREKKTNKHKTFVLNDSCRSALKLLLEEFNEAQSEDYLFPSLSNRVKNKPVSRQYVWDFMNQYARLAGSEERVGTHTLRKTFGYFAYQKGISLELLQAILNHNSSKETLLYIGITQDEINDVYINLNL
ncbi:MAG: site-specific integrase [Candidatus Moranbacteria bacterium]|nr:site-specific integrase [Candidatus Moranbacteria bacterium]